MRIVCRSAILEHPGASRHDGARLALCVLNYSCCRTCHVSNSSYEPPRLFRRPGWLTAKHASCVAWARWYCTSNSAGGTEPSVAGKRWVSNQATRASGRHRLHAAASGAARSTEFSCGQPDHACSERRLSRVTDADGQGRRSAASARSAHGIATYGDPQTA